MGPKKQKFFETTVKVRDVQPRYGEGYSLTSRPKKKKVKKYDNVMPTGIDDGKGARKLLGTYVDDVLGSKQQEEHTVISLEAFTDDFYGSNFIDQISHTQMKNVPLKSQVARQQAKVAYNPTEKKKLFIDLANRMKRDDHFLVKARLAHEGIDDTALKLISTALTRNTQLQHLMLHDNYFSDDGLKELCLALRWHPALHTLWVGLNRVTDIGARHLSFLMKFSASLRELNLSNRWPSEVWHPTEFELHPHVTYIGAQYFANQLQKGCGLTSLTLADQRIRDDGAIYLFKALKDSSLRALNIMSNELSDRCCEELRFSLIENPLLEMLILSHNRISDDGSIHIAYGLAENSVLRVCDLSYNKIDAKGLDALYLCLQYNTTLTALMTSYNAADPDDDRAEQLVASRNNGFGVQNASAKTLFHNKSSAAGGSTDGDDDDDEDIGFPSTKTLTRQNSWEIGTKPSFVDRNSVKSSIDVPAVEMYGRSILSEAHRNIANSASASRSYDDGDTMSQLSADSGRMKGSGSRRAANVTTTTAAISAAAADGVGTVGTVGDSDNNSYSNNSDNRDNNEGAEYGISGKGSSSRKLMGLPTPPALSRPIGETTTTEARTKAADSSAGLDVGEGNSRGNSRGNARPQSPPAPMLGGGRKAVGANSSKSDANDVARRRKLARQNSITSNRAAGSFVGKISKANSFISGRSLDNSGSGSAVTSRQSSAADLLAAAQPAPVYVYDGPQKKSRDLGKTTGVPYIKNIGIKPVRSSITAQRDSAQHLLYLRVSTPYDAPNERPYPLVSIGRDREETIKAQRDARQTEKYKSDKAYLIENLPKKIVHQAALPKVPEYFWDAWRRKIRLQYLSGIDNAPGCTSTKLEPLVPIVKATTKSLSNSLSRVASTESALSATAAAGIIVPNAELGNNNSSSEAVVQSAYDLVQHDPSQAFRRHLQFKSRNMTPGAILAARRKENRMRKEAEENTAQQS